MADEHRQTARNDRLTTYLLRASSSASNVFCALNSFINVSVATSSALDGPDVAIGGVTPRYLDVYISILAWQVG
jgi:hypothetical protein